MTKLWDDFLKRMFKANPQHFLNWLAPGAILLDELSPVLRTRTLEADMLNTILWHGKKIILHIEFQRRGDKNMGKRLWEYNSTTKMTSGLTVYSVVIYLTKGRKIVDPPYIESLPNGDPNHVFFYKSIKLWELPADLFLQSGLEGLLPLISLTHNGKSHGIVNTMIERLIVSSNFDLLELGYNFAGLVFTTGDERDWLARRFKMYRDKLEKSWVYQDILKEGLEKGIKEGREKGLKQGLEQGLEQGRVEGIRQTLLKYVEARFPAMLDLTREQTSLIKNADILQNATMKLFTLQTSGEVEEYLLSLGDDATKN
jgi:predicted transposase YdaD